jgi:hypothetical protein
MSRSRYGTGGGRVLPLVAASVALVLALGATAFWWGGGLLDGRGEPADAQVLALEEGRRGVVTATVRFETADGRTITTRTRPDELVVPPPAIGETIPIVYDPEDPEASVRDPRARDGVTGPGALAAVGVCAAGALVVLVGRWWRTRGTRPIED